MSSWREATVGPALSTVVQQARQLRMTDGDLFVTTTSDLMVIREAEAPLTRGIDQGDEQVALAVLRAAASSTSAVTRVIPDVLCRVADADWWGFVERREDFWRCAESTLSQELHTGAEHFVPGDLASCCICHWRLPKLYADA